MKILNFGSLNVDYVYTVDHMVQPGETLASQKMEDFPGGKGLNQSISLARAGAEVYHAGQVGEDGLFLKKLCEENGVDCTYLKEIPGKNGNAVIQVDQSGQNCILLYGGSNRTLTKEFIDEVIGHFDSGDLILLQNEVNLMDYIIERAYEQEMIIALNPSPYNEAMEACDLSKVTYFLMNEIEGGQITGKTQPEDILDVMLERYPDAKVVLTLGKDGVVYRDKEEQCTQGIFKVKAVDTTAAGDTFTGYFLSGVLGGDPVAEALCMASKASAIAVSRQGASPSIPWKKEVEETEL